MSLCHKDNQIYFRNSSFSFVDVVTLKSKNKTILQELIYNISYVWKNSFWHRSFVKAKSDALKGSLPNGTFLFRIHTRSFFTVKSFGEFIKVRQRTNHPERYKQCLSQTNQLEIIQVFKQSKRMPFFSECLVSAWLVEETGYESRQTSKLKTTVL